MYQRFKVHSYEDGIKLRDFMKKSYEDNLVESDSNCNIYDFDNTVVFSETALGIGVTNIGIIGNNISEFKSKLEKEAGIEFLEIK